LNTKFEERFQKFDKETKKYKENLRESIRNLQNRINYQSGPSRARSPQGDFDLSAMLSKRKNDESK